MKIVNNEKLTRNIYIKRSFEVRTHIEASTSFEELQVDNINILFVQALNLVPVLTISPIFTFPTSITSQEGNHVLV